MDPIGIFVAGLSDSDLIVGVWQPKGEMPLVVCPDPSDIVSSHGAFDIDEGICDGLPVIIIQYRTFDVTAVFKDGRAVGGVEFIDGDQVHD